MPGPASTVGFTAAPFDPLLPSGDGPVVAALTAYPGHEYRVPMHGGAGHNRPLGVAKVARGRKPEADGGVWQTRILTEWMGWLL